MCGSRRGKIEAINNSQSNSIKHVVLEIWRKKIKSTKVHRNRERHRNRFYKNTEKLRKERE